MTISVLSAAGGAAWEAGLLAAFEPGSGGGGSEITVVRRCVDVVELLALAATGQARAALVSDRLRRWDADAVDRLLAADVIPVGVVGRGDAEAEDRMRAMGVAHLVPDDADPSVIASVIVAAVADGTRGGRASARPDRRFGDPGASATVSVPAADVLRSAGPIPPGTAVPGHAEVEETGRRGTVLAVWGPTGAPGRTTVAVGLADELARLGASTLLIDAEVYGATIAAVLGLLDESPGLAAACRQAASTRLTVEALAQLCWQLTPNLRVLTGVPLAQRWPELRPAGVESVVATARSLADFVVVDCGFCLETDEELSFDTLAPRRNGATLAVLDHADVVVAVGSADPIGMQRLVRALSDLRDAEVAAPVQVVLNRVRSGAVPGDSEHELAAALERFAGRTPAALLPLDQDATDAAISTGRTLGDISGNGGLRRALAGFAAQLAGVQAVSGRRRRRR